MKHTVISMACTLLLLVAIGAAIIFPAVLKAKVPDEVEPFTPTETKEMQTPLPSEELDNTTTTILEETDTSNVSVSSPEVSTSTYLILPESASEYIGQYSITEEDLHDLDQRIWDRRDWLIDWISDAYEIPLNRAVYRLLEDDYVNLRNYNSHEATINNMFYSEMEGYLDPTESIIDDYDEESDPQYSSTITQHGLYDLSILTNDNYIYSLYFYNDYGEIFGSLEQNRGTKDGIQRHVGYTPYQTLAIYSNSPFANLNDKRWSAWNGSNWISYNLTSVNDAVTKIQTTIADLACTIYLSDDGLALFDFGMSYGAFNYSYTLTYTEDTTNPILDDLEAKLLSGNYTFEYINDPNISELGKYSKYVTSTTYLSTYGNSASGTVTSIDLDQYLTITEMTVHYTNEDGFEMTERFKIHDDGRCDVGTWTIYSS
jgi:hypothetical protein